MAEERGFTAASFNAFLNEKKLMATRCVKCGALYLPPRPFCTSCYNADMEWVELKGRGKLTAYTVIAVGPMFMVEEGYDREHRYCSGIVQMDEGPSISARILDVDVKHPEAIEIGTPLGVCFLSRGDGESKKTFLAFKKTG
jgi:uncharacterized OB-fold protein